MRQRTDDLSALVDDQHLGLWHIFYQRDAFLWAQDKYGGRERISQVGSGGQHGNCLLYTSDAADE